MEAYIKKRLVESANVKLRLVDSYNGDIEDVADAIVKSYKKKGKVVLMGNGGSASQCQHIAAEFVVRYEMERPGLEAIALTADTSILTAASNDFGYENIFEKQVESIVKKKDVVIGLTTSGSSVNIIKGLKKAKDIGAATVALTGEKGLYTKFGYEPLRLKIEKMIADYIIKVPSQRTSVIQEAHLTLLHIICDLVEKKLFGGKRKWKTI
ncbi:MAG: SIS domain-containing protein [Nanoarchaeota archaeon]|nr:SIS domain-containing protein [Nanoarchaeota archaeon]